MGGRLDGQDETLSLLEEVKEQIALGVRAFSGYDNVRALLTGEARFC